MMFQLKDVYNKLFIIISKAKVTYMTSHKLETNDMEKYLLPRKVTNNNKLREFHLKYYTDIWQQTPYCTR